MKISINEFLKKRKESKPSFVFDLRDMDDYEKDHLIGSHNLPFEFMESSLFKMPFTGDLLFYDSGDGIVKQAATLLDENGFGDYFYIDEGLNVLKEALQNSEYDIKMVCTSDDPKKVKMEVIQNLFDLEINPMVAAHGGHFSLLDIKENNVFVQLGGGCQGCSMVDVTLRQGVEKRIREVFPGMKSLIDQTDHAGGENPYYQEGK